MRWGQRHQGRRAAEEGSLLASLAFRLSSSSSAVGAFVPGRVAVDSTTGLDLLQGTR